MKSLRKKRGMTIADIASRTGIDKGTVSRIENGKMRGTLDSHSKIAEVLGIRLPELYENVLAEAESQRDVPLRKKLQSFSHSSGAVTELLTTGSLQKKMMPTLLRMKPRGRTESEECASFTERFIYVLQGKLKAVIGREITELNKGESLYFSASRPHHFENASKVEARILSVITPVSL